MKKDEILKFLDIATFALIIIATVLVVIFEFVGGYGFMKCSVVLYFVGLLLLTVLLSIRIYYAFGKNKVNGTVLNENTSESNTKSNVDEMSKKQKIGLILMLVASIIILIFTFVVMILY